MRNRLLTLLIAVATLFACVTLRAQPQQAEDPQAVMQEMRQQILQNMAARGIDPQQFFQEIGQKMQNGSLDPADIQKLMIDKGIIDQKMIDRMQTAMQSGMMSNIREQLGSTDDEWKVLLPKIQKVVLLSTSID